MTGRLSLEAELIVLPEDNEEIARRQWRNFQKIHKSQGLQVPSASFSVHSEPIRLQTPPPADPHRQFGEWSGPWVGDKLIRALQTLAKLLLTILLKSKPSNWRTKQHEKSIYTSARLGSPWRTGNDIKLTYSYQNWLCFMAYLMPMYPKED